jgi:hypothetical protein
LRRGIANRVLAADLDPTVSLRATIPIDLTLSGTNLDGSISSSTIHRDVGLYGPGDVIGIDARAVIKVEPRDWITNFESNHLPYVEFYDEDFPWRYTPAAADTSKHRLRPWIALLVLKASELSEGQDMKGKPLPYIELLVEPAGVLPSPSELWAWAHVHVNNDLSLNGDRTMPGVVSRLTALVDADPDRAYARVLCPRHLEADTDYHAFVIPTFEAGRLAGLGLPVPDTIVATASAWDGGQRQFPYYYRWYFRTGDLGDFEYLARLLQPRPVDGRVGVRDMDVVHPGSNLPPINLPAELEGVLKLGGALRVPFETLPPSDQADVAKYDAWDQPYPHPFEVAMAARIDLADDYAALPPSRANPDGDPDPIVTSPLYGRWHALINRVLKARDGTDLPNRENWVHRLNLDPRFRVGAGFGTSVVDANDESLMNAAWEQVGDVIAANERLRFAQLATSVSASLYERHIAPLEPERALIVTAPLHARLMSGDVTALSRVRTSLIPPVATSAPFRRATRQGTALVKRLALAPATAAAIVARINAGELHPAPRKTAPSAVIGVKDAVAAISPTDEPPQIRDLLARYPWLRWLPLLVLLVLATAASISGPWTLAVVALIAGPLLFSVYRRLSRWSEAGALSRSIEEEQATPASVERIPPISNFVITAPGASFTPLSGAQDSPEGTRFKAALRDAYTYTSIAFQQPVKAPLALSSLASSIVGAIDPRVTIRRRIDHIIHIPTRIGGQSVEPFAPVMAYPVFDLPMYKPLVDISTELFLPRLDLIPPNSATLLEANRRFIEAYMVGLNHEMARELLWRAYPTDQRGSYFRQFWDVSVRLPPSPTRADRDALRDITELHTWPETSALGSHDPRNAGDGSAPLVLVLRGELLKRYPTAVIYAHKAAWHTNDDGSVDPTQERSLVALSPSEEDAPPVTKIRVPMFEATVDPDISFFGFDLNTTEAKGGTTASDDPGWFFVIKERPGEPRFGLNESPGEKKPRLIQWGDIAWAQIGVVPGGVIALDQTLSFDAYDPAIDLDDKPNPDDAQAIWSPATNAADLAYITYRVPQLVALHASRMLP